MPQTCSAAGCRSRKDKDCKKSFFRIPVDRNQRERWIAAINRPDWTPTQYSRICSDHFVLGQPSKDPNHPDYAPSLYLESKHRNSNNFSRPSKVSTHKLSPVLTPINTTSEQTNKRYLSDVDAAEALLHMSKRPRVVKEDCRITKEERECVSFNCHLALLQAENQLLREEIDKLRVQRTELEVQKRNVEVEKLSLADQNKQLEANYRLVLKSLEEREDMVKTLKNDLFLLTLGAEIVSSRL